MNREQKLLQRIKSVSDTLKKDKCKKQSAEREAGESLPELTWATSAVRVRGGGERDRILE